MRISYNIRVNTFRMYDFIGIQLINQNRNSVHGRRNTILLTIAG